jgi:hypothetical protein
MIGRPAPSEYAPYYQAYIDAVPEGDVLGLLVLGIEDTIGLLGDLDELTALHRYAEGKWSIKEIIGHLSDTERIFAYRALRFARADQTPLPGYEQDNFVEHGGFDARSVSELLDEFRTVRAASVALFRGMSPEMFSRKGTASGFEFTVRAIPYILAGHERHHVTVIKLRYL